MKRFAPVLALLLIACVSKDGLSAESSKYPAGNASSSIVVQEFADFQCPACRGAHNKIVLPLLEKHGRNIRFEFRHMPLRQIHPYAQEAAEASECAADQKKFWEFVDDTFENQERLKRDDLIARAEKIGVADMDLFERCVKSRIKRDAVQNDYDKGRKMGVSGTPTYFVNGKKVARNTIEEVTKMIEEKIRSQRL